MATPVAIAVPDRTAGVAVDATELLGRDGVAVVVVEARTGTALLAVEVALLRLDFSRAFSSVRARLDFSA